MSDLPDTNVYDGDNTKLKLLAAPVEKLHRLDANVLQVCSSATAAGSSAGSPTNAASSLHSDTVGDLEDEPSTAIDIVLDRIDACMRKLFRVKRSVIKRRVADADLLTQVEAARDLLQVALQGDKLQLNVTFGGQCIRIGRLRYMLETVELSDMYANDQRWKHIQSRVESVESILKELGTYKRWVPPVQCFEGLSHSSVSQTLVPFLEARMDTFEIEVATLTPEIAGFWDGPHDSRIEIRQEDDAIEILIEDELRGNFSFDHVKAVFVGELDSEKMDLSVDNGALKLSNGVTWEKRPVDVAGSWDLPSGCRFVITQKGAQVVMVQQGEPMRELRGTIATDAITIEVEQEIYLSKDEKPDAELSSEASLSGTFDAARKTINWSDGTVWLKRPETDIAGIWDEVADSGTYYQGMALSMLGSVLTCDHITLGGEGIVDDAAGVSFHFDNRGEATAQVATSLDTITWADGTQWRKRLEGEVQVNIMEDSSISKWRRRYSFGPMRRSFYLDSFSPESDEDANSHPDLFYVNKRSTGVTQAAYSNAFGSFCHRIHSTDSLDEALGHRGAGITLPQNWMVWMVHRVWLNDPSITSLSFANMEIPEARLEKLIGPKLMEALKHNTFLETLELQNTNLQTNEIIPVLADALKVNTTLKSINLEGNAIDSAGLVALADSLKENSTLEVLKVHHQKTRSSGMQVEERFHAAMNVNTTLVKLGIALQHPGHRDQVDRKLMQNAEKKRRMRRSEATK